MDDPWAESENAWLRRELMRALQRNDELTEAHSRLSVQLAALAERLEGVQEVLVGETEGVEALDLAADGVGIGAPSTVGVSPAVGAERSEGAAEHLLDRARQAHVGAEAACQRAATARARSAWVEARASALAGRARRATASTAVPSSAVGRGAPGKGGGVATGRRTSALARLDATATAEEVAAVLARDGCCVVERLVDGEVMDRLWAEVEPYVEATRAGRDDFAGTLTRRTGALVARSATFRDELVAHPLVLGTASGVLGPHAPRVQLHLTQVIDIGPGETGQMVHRDQWAFDFSFPEGMECLCNTMWALSDFSEANGGTRVIPGSHRWADKLKPAYAETIGVDMPKGSVLFYTGSVYHGGGANRTAERRLGINVGYTLSWLRQEENQYLACPPAVARHLPIELLRLIGYSMGGYALGYFGDTQDPLEALGIDPRQAKGNGRYTISGSSFG